MSLEKSAYNCYIFLFSIQGPWELPTALACIHYEINQELSKLSENKCGQWNQYLVHIKQRSAFLISGHFIYVLDSSNSG